MQGNVTNLIVLVGGTAVEMMFLFTLSGEYVDRELEARGLANTGVRGGDDGANPIDSGRRF